MKQIIDKKNLEFNIDILYNDSVTGKSSCVFSDNENAGKSGSIYDYPSLMRVLYQKNDILPDDLLADLYSLTPNRIAFILEANSFNSIVCIITIPNMKNDIFGSIINLLKKNKVNLINYTQGLITEKNRSVQKFNSGVRLFPRYKTERLNVEIAIDGVTQEIDLIDASIGGICIKSATPPAILEFTKKIKINFSKFKYEFLTTVKWTNLEPDRTTKVGIKFDFQTKQELSNWQTFIYALYIKQKK